MMKELNKTEFFNENKVKTKEVYSANKLYLFCGLLSVSMIIILEFVAIREIIIADDKIEACCLAIFLQVLVLLCLLLSTTIGDYIHRVKFNIYYCKLENGIDIEYIRENYYIEDINEKCVLFVDKENDRNFCVWKLFQGYDFFVSSRNKNVSRVTKQVCTT